MVFTATLGVVQLARGHEAAGWVITSRPLVRLGREGIAELELAAARREATGDELAVLVDTLDPATVLQDRDVGQRIAVHHEEVREQAGTDAPDDAGETD